MPWLHLIFLRFKNLLEIIIPPHGNHKKLKTKFHGIALWNQIIGIILRPLSKIPLYSYHSKSLEKMETMFMQNFGGTNKEYYGIFESDVCLGCFSYTVPKF